MPSHNIKLLKPNRNARTRQGYVNPLKCHRLFESQKIIPIIYRSSWEFKFMQWCETSPNVRHWGSECVPIEYTLISDNTTHTYYPDYIVELNSGECWLVEIKPFAQTQRPRSPYDSNSVEWKTYIKNYCKWKAAKDFANRNGLKFKILTEHTIEKLGC